MGKITTLAGIVGISSMVLDFFSDKEERKEREEKDTRVDNRLDSLERVVANHEDRLTTCEKDVAEMRADFYK